MTQVGTLAMIASALSQGGSGPDPFHATLRLGEIIRGRVLRSLGPSRYAVDFSGHERVVDSAIPLRTDEILYGRVVALNDKVELQRVSSEAARFTASAQVAADTRDAQSPTAVPSAMVPLLERWTPDVVAAVQRLVDQASDKAGMMLAAATVARTGLPYSRDMIELAYSMLSRQTGNGAFPIRSDAIVLETAALSTTDPAGGENAAARNPLALAEFAKLLQAQFEAGRQSLVESPMVPAVSAHGANDAESTGESSARRSRGDDDATRDADIGGALFNVQMDGAVSHATATVPFIVDGRLVELDVALFQQGRNSPDDGSLPHGRVVIALNTEHLGRLEIVATLVGKHVQLNLSSDDAGAAEYMAGHATALRSEVEADGWNVDQIRYRADETGTSGGIARVIMEHMVSPGSLSQLV